MRISFFQNRSNTVEPKDTWTIVRIEGRYNLVESSESDFATLDPILQDGIENHVHEDVRILLRQIYYSIVILCIWMTT